MEQLHALTSHVGGLGIPPQNWFKMVWDVRGTRIVVADDVDCSAW